MSINNSSLTWKAFASKWRIFFRRSSKPRSSVFSPPKPTKEAISEIGRILASSKKYIALTGPRVSSLSGFKDLRDPTHDLWKKYNYRLWDYKLFKKQPELLWRLWPEIDKAVSKVKPNIIHEILGQWQVEGKLGAVITQNYDSANDKAAIEKLIELEGSSFFATCLTCGTHHKRPYVEQKLLQAAPEKMIYLPPNEQEQVAVDYSLPDDPAFMNEDEKKYVKVIKTPLCSQCFGPLKFDIPLNNEPRKGLPHMIALNEMKSAPDVFLGIGFYGLEEPSDLLPGLARSHGAKVIFINEEASAIDDEADIVVHGKIDELMREIDDAKNKAELDMALNSTKPAA